MAEKRTGSPGLSGSDAFTAESFMNAREQYGCRAMEYAIFPYPIH